MPNVGGRPKQRFCKWGHDTWQVGREARGTCQTCKTISNRGGSIEGKPKPKPATTPEWERERVKRWLEIAGSDPIPEASGSVRRLREFNSRYQRLEADVPTPGARV